MGWIGVGMLMLVSGIGDARAQSVPEQGVPSSPTLHNVVQRMLRYYQRQLQQQILNAPINPLKQPAAKTSTPNAHRAASTQRFVLKQVVFSPSELLPPSALHAAVAPFIGHSVGTSELKQILAKVNALYTAREITTARAMLPGQTIGKSGVLHIKLVEGRLGTLKIHGLPDGDDEFIRTRIHQPSGAVVDSNRLRRDLVYINRTTDLKVKALLQPGSRYGMTDILVNVAAPPSHRFDVFVDNNGVASTGRLEEGVSLRVHGIFGVDDNFAGDIVHSQGGNDGSLSYSVPVTDHNSRVRLAYSRSQINIVNGPFRKLDIVGHSNVATVAYTQPFVATLHWLLSGIGSYSVSESTTSISGKPVADTRSRSVSVGMELSHQRGGQRWGVTQLFTRMRSDEAMLGKRNFFVAPGNAYFMQRLGGSKWVARANLGWQFSSGDNVPSASLFQIGGIGSVRGYQRGVLAGAHGYYLGVELHRVFGQSFDLYVFADHGQVGAFYPASAGITGAGLGALYRYRSWLTVTAAVAKPFETVTPDQDSVRAIMRVAVHWK